MPQKGRQETFRTRRDGHCLRASRLTGLIDEVHARNESHAKQPPGRPKHRHLIMAPGIQFEEHDAMPQVR